MFHETLVVANTLVSHLHDLAEILLQYLEGTELFLLILLYWLWRDELLRHSTCDQHIVFFRYLHPTLLRIKLTDLEPIAHPVEVELLRFVSCEIDDIEPGDIGIFAVRFQDMRRAIEKSFKSLDENRTKRTSA